jgi:hypothetical protein
MSNSAATTTAPVQAGRAMKWPLSRLAVWWARMEAGDSAGDTGVLNSVPTPAAVAPTITMRSRSKSAATRPANTSWNDTVGKALMPLRSA